MVKRATFSEALEDVVDNGDGSYSRRLAGVVPVGGTFGTTGMGMVARDANSVTARAVRAGIFGDLYMEGGSVVSKLASSAGTNNATNIKSTAGKLYGVTGQNTNAAARWLKFMNKASAPVPGADAPTLSLYLPPTAAFNFSWPNGIQFGTGIGYWIVTGAAELDNTAVTAADILNLNILYT